MQRERGEMGEDIRDASSDIWDAWTMRAEMVNNLLELKEEGMCLRAPFCFIRACKVATCVANWSACQPASQLKPSKTPSNLKKIKSV